MMEEINKPKAHNETCAQTPTSQRVMEPNIIPEDTRPQNKTIKPSNSIEDDYITISAPPKTLNAPSNTNTTTTNK